MKTICIQNATLIHDPAPIEDVTILIEDGTIVLVGVSENFRVGKEAAYIDASGLLVAPGLIDLQCNGGFGHDFTHDPTTISDVAAQLPRYGVTTFLPTIITSPLQTIAQAQAELRHAVFEPASAEAIGLHIEGPFLNPAKKGAHNAIHLKMPTLAEVADWRPESGIRLVTLAPELEGADGLIRVLAQNGVVVSMGHSNATQAEATAAIDAGVRYGTHLFNAMAALHHREPGLVGALLDDARVTLGLIPDGVHVDARLIKLVWRLAAGRINVVTDSMAAMGCEPGNYQLGDRRVVVDERSARLESGTLAGSIVTLDLALRNLISWTGCTPAEALRTVTEIPADLLGLEHKGRVAVGCDGDLVLFNRDLTVNTTICKGEIAYAQ